MQVLDIVYHYCSADAFLSILKSARLWVSDARRTNDRQELKWFKDLALQYLKTYAKIDGNIEAIVKTLDYHFELVGDISDYFVCCFSGDRDSVPQWSTYADRGAGFSIGFDVNALRMSVGAPIFDAGYSPVSAQQLALQGWSFAPVFYGEPGAGRAQLDRLKDLIAIGPFVRNDAARLAREHIDCICAFCKHPGFSTEREWRIVYNATLPTQQTAESNLVVPRKHWRRGSYGLTPYFETPDIRKCIREVIIGPSNIDREAPEYVTKFLESVDVSARVEVSKSPYR